MAGNLCGAENASGAIINLGPVDLLNENDAPDGDYQALEAGAGYLVAVNQAFTLKRLPGGASKCEKGNHCIWRIYLQLFLTQL